MSLYIESISPVIDDITEIVLTVGSISTVVWNVSDLTPDEFWVYVNSTLFYSGKWNSDTITVEFSPLTVGTYNVTIVVQDRNGYSSSDQFILHIVSDDTILTNIIILAVVSSIGVILVAVIIIKKRLRHG